MTLTIERAELDAINHAETLVSQMHDTLEALPPGTTADWLANYHFHRQDYFTRPECLTYARVAISSY